MELIIVKIDAPQETNLILGVIDGESPKGIETEKDEAERKKFLRSIGYKK